jgi:uncharacterized protein
MITSSQKLLTICFDETDSYGDLPLYEAIVRRLVQLGMSGATVNRGIMGFGPKGLLHRKGLFGVSDDRPITIQVVDKEEKLLPILAELREMVAEGPIYLQDVTIVE